MKTTTERIKENELQIAHLECSLSLKKVEQAKLLFQWLIERAHHKEETNYQKLDRLRDIASQGRTKPPHQERLISKEKER